MQRSVQKVAASLKLFCENEYDPGRRERRVNASGAADIAPGGMLHFQDKARCQLRIPHAPATGEGAHAKPLHQQDRVVQQTRMSQEELKRLLAEGKTARARQLMQEMGQQVPPGTRPPRPYVSLLLLVVVIIPVAAGTIWIIGLFGLKALEGFAPVLEIVFSPLAHIVLSPIALGIAGGFIAIIGLQLAPKFRRPDRFRNGAIAVALAVSTFWPLQFLASRVNVRFWEFSWGLHLLAGFISVCLLTGGLELMRMANNTPKDDSWEFLRRI